MRYLFGFLCVCVVVGASPLSASAQDAEEGATSEPNIVQEPALKLELDTAGVEVVPSPPRTFPDRYTEMRLRVRRAKIGLGVSAVVMVVGTALAFGGGAASICLSEPCSRATGLTITGSIMAGGGAAGMVASGILLGVRKRKLRRLQF
jgi:hypothetical protein